MLDASWTKSCISSQGSGLPIFGANAHDKKYLFFPIYSQKFPDKLRFSFVKFVLKLEIACLTILIWKKTIADNQSWYYDDLDPHCFPNRIYWGLACEGLSWSAIQVLVSKDRKIIMCFEKTPKFFFPISDKTLDFFPNFIVPRPQSKICGKTPGTRP